MRQLLCVLVLSIAGLAAARGADGLSRESRQLDQPVDRVVLAAVGELHITQGLRQALTIEAEARLLPLVRTQVRGNTLRIDFVAGEVSTRRPIRYYLTLKSVRAIEVESSGDVYAQALQTPALRLVGSGSGNMLIGSLETQQLSARLEGAGDIEIGAGRTTRQSVSVDGSGNYRAAAMHSATGEVMISGSGEAQVAVSAQLDAIISGSGDILYRGAPRLRQSISGAGSVTAEQP